MSGRASDFAAGVCTRTAEVEIGDRRPVVRPTGKGTLGKILAGNNIEVSDIAVGETDPPFQVDGCEQ